MLSGKGIFMGFYLDAEKGCKIRLLESETEAVKIAAKNLKQDLIKVFDCGFEVKVEDAAGQGVQSEGKINSTAGRATGEATSEETENGKSDGSRIVIATLPVFSPGEEVQQSLPEGFSDRKEAYCLLVKKGQLYIIGTDRRGTIYGIYELSEMLGVSPWYFWGDAPVKTRENFTLEEGFIKWDYPSVEYRGIFINDEEELEAWVKNRMGEETIGVKTYEKIFELLLRLKGNYIWPAMHVNSFNVKQENGALAERMGMVVGTSHCDMLMRSNNREWKPWLEKKGYQNVEYDYSLSGRNREILQEYWRESVEQNREFEVSYTLGMRGIHDSGFETRALEGLSGEELKQEKIKLLQQVMEDQRQILQDTLGKLPLMNFVPYKEVLPLYDGGLQVPEDITLVWSNDNYGYIRRYPSESEKKRRGGNGIYYHNSYWAPAGMSYVFLCSIPLAHTANELRKAYGEGIRKLWVINTGAMKPLEQEITFFLSLAWNIGKPGEKTADVEKWTADWIDRTFSGNIGKKTAVLLNDFSQLTNERKLEMMDQFAFSQTAYGDEAVTRIHTYERLFREGNRIYTELPEAERPAFFELVLMRLHAGYFTNLAYYYGDRSTLANSQGKKQAALFYAKEARKLEDTRRRMLYFYNEKMLSGKWKGILNPEGFPPPRAAMMPVCTPPLQIEKEPKLCVTVWNNEKEISFHTSCTKWLEIGNAGGGSLEFSIEAPDWLELSCKSGRIETEARILIKPVEVLSKKETGIIRIAAGNTGESVALPVSCEIEETEEDGVVFVRADSVAPPEGFRLIERLGRGTGKLLEVYRGKSGQSEKEQEREKGQENGQEEEQKQEKTVKPQIKYQVKFNSAGEFLLEIHRFPSLNSVGRIRIGCRVDGGEVILLESESRDEHLGSWRENVRNGIDRLYARLPYLEAGGHEISFEAIDNYFAFSSFAVYTKERRRNNLLGVTWKENQSLPRAFDADSFAECFYGETEILPRPIEYARVEEEADGLAAKDAIVQEKQWGAPVRADWYLEEQKAPFAEQDGVVLIDMAKVLSGSGNAFSSGGDWKYCLGESFGRSGLVMYRPPVSMGEGIYREEFLKNRAEAVAETEENVFPALHYRVNCSGGSYTCWLLSKFNMREEAFFQIRVDEKDIPREETYNRGCLWRYEAEQIYRWVPVARIELEAGVHTISIGAAAGLRLDRLYLTKGEDRPPLDTGWHPFR